MIMSGAKVVIEHAHLNFGGIDGKQEKLFKYKGS